MKAFITAVIGISHINTIALAHQFPAFGASSAISIRIPPEIHESFCDNILVGVLVPFVKVEGCKPVSVFLGKQFPVCSAYRLCQPA